MKRRLDDLLVARGLAESRSVAQRLVLGGKIRVRDVPSPKPGNTYPEDVGIELLAPDRFVSRGGEKLEGAFEAFGLDVEGLRCLDVGASTGGFTDCLLQHGAAEVVALDVGHGQLHPSLRADPRVTVIEKFNARHLTPADLPWRPEFAVCDVSFISLRLILPPMADVVAPGSQLVTLIKPQFEAGREKVGRGGVVRDEATRLEVVETIRGFGLSIGLTWNGVCVSPITGPKGNVEYVAWWTKG
ncbi:MAG: TlyA family RNA methyltransferase [Kiritimatiellia bacterium]